jgi:quinol monooxygenase YgiN
MFGGIAKIVVKPGQKDALLEFLRWDAEVCRTEPGTLRFDVWLDPSDDSVVVLYETYTDRAAFEVHQAAEPFKKFVAEIVPNMVESVSFVIPFGTSLVSNADRQM